MAVKYGLTKEEQEELRAARAQNAAGSGVQEQSRNSRFDRTTNRMRYGLSEAEQQYFSKSRSDKRKAEIQQINQSAGWRETAYTKARAKTASAYDSYNSLVEDYQALFDENKMLKADKADQKTISELLSRADALYKDRTSGTASGLKALQESLRSIQARNQIQNMVSAAIPDSWERAIGKAEERAAKVQAGAAAIPGLTGDGKKWAGFETKIKTESVPEPAETYTAENVGDYMNRAAYLLTLPEWTDEQKQEAKSIQRAITAPPMADSYLKRLGQEDSEEAAVKAKEASAIADELGYRISPFAAAATALGGSFVRGTGLPSLAQAAGAALGIESWVREIDQFNQRVNQASSTGTGAKIASGIGGTIGGLTAFQSAAGLAGKAAGAIQGFSSLTPTMQGAAKTAITFMLTDAARNAGDVATGKTDIGSYAESVVESGLGGAAGSVASAMVTSGIAQSLIKHNLQTPFMEFLRQLSGGTVFAAASTGTEYAFQDPEERPSAEAVAQQMATAFLFSVINSSISTVQTTKANRARMEAAVQQMQQDYQNMAQGAMSQEEMQQAAQRMMRYSGDIRSALDQNYYAGQQDYIDQVRSALDVIDDYVANAAGGTAPGAEAPLLGAGSAGAESAAGGMIVSPAGGGGGAAEAEAMAREIQAAVASGLEDANNLRSLEQTAPPEAAEPAQDLTARVEALDQEFGNAGPEPKTQEARIAERADALYREFGGKTEDAMVQTGAGQKPQSAVQEAGEPAAQTFRAEQRERQGAEKTGQGTVRAAQAATARNAAQMTAKTGKAGTSVRGTDVVKAVKIGDNDIVIQKTDGSTASINTLDQRGTALEVLQFAKELPDYRDTMTVNGMMRAYESYLGSARGNRSIAERFFDNYVIAVAAGAEGESLADALGVTTDRKMQTAMESGWRRGVEIAKGRRISMEMGSAGQAAMEQYGYLYPQMFSDFYRAGQQGASFQQAMEAAGVKSLGEIKKTEMKAAWKAGRKDGMDYEVERYAVSDAGGQRENGLGAGGKAGSLEAGTGGSEGREGGRVGRRGGGDAENRTSLKKLGVKSGTDAPQEVVSREKNEHGGEIITVSDRLLVRGQDGTEREVQAIQSGNNVILRADDPMLEQHKAHELEHIRQRSMTDEEITAVFREKTKSLSDKRLRRILSAYALDYYGLYGEDDTTMEDLYREYLADEAAGIRHNETDQDVIMPGGQTGMTDRRGEVYAMRGNQNQDYFTRDKYYDRQIDKWEQLKRGGYITVGTVNEGSPLNQIGIPAGKLYFDVTKIRAEMEERSDPIGPEIMKGIPDVLANPIVITEFIDRNGTPSASVYGKLYIHNSPVVVGVMTAKTQKGVVVSKVQTVHAKRNFMDDIKPDKVLYINGNKKETRAWFQSLSAQMPPLGEHKSGFIRSISQKAGKSNIADKFSISSQEPQSSAEYRQMQQDSKQREALMEQSTKQTFELRRQFTEGTERDLLASDLPGIAADLRRIYGKKSMGQTELQERLEHIATVKAGERSPMEAYRRAKDEADILAADMIRNAMGQTEEAADDWNGIKAAFRSGGKPVKLFLDGANRMDLETEGGYEGMRKRLMGYAFLSSGGVPVDVFYQEELSSRFPGYFPASIQNPADQLIRIVSVIDQFRAIFRSPYAGGMAEDTEMLSQDILQRLYNSMTPSGNAAAFAEQHEDMVRAYYETKLQSTRDAWKKQVEQMKQSFADKQQEQRTAREERKDREKLLHILQRLKRVRPGAFGYEKAMELIGNIDTVAVSLTGKTIIGDYIGNVSSEGIKIDSVNKKGQTVVKLDDLKNFIDQMIKEKPDFLLPNSNMMNKIERLNQMQIADMEIADVRALIEVALELENAIKTYNKLIQSEEKREISVLSKEIRADIEASGGVKPASAEKFISDRITTQGLSPVRFIRRITGFNDDDPLYRAILEKQKGETKMHDYGRRAEERFRSFRDDKAFMASLSGKKSKAIEITGRTPDGIKTVKITPDMRIAIYLHSKNDANVRHAELGGMKIPDYRLLMQGFEEDAYAQGIFMYLSRSQMQAIADGMTVQERNYANAIWEYFNRFSPEEINAVSRLLIGYDLATVWNHYPIEAVKNYTKAEPETVKHDANITSAGWTKSRTGAANPIVLRGATETLERAIAQHAKYVGLAIPVRNFGKLYGNTSWYISPDPDDQREIQTVTSSVRDVLDRKWGTKAGGYIDKLMADVQNPVKKKDDIGEILDKVRSNYAGSTLVLSASVGMVQAASYPTAAAVVGWKALGKAAIYLLPGVKVNLETVEKYTPLLWYRSKGYSTKELGDLAKGNKSLPKALNWITGIDIKTTSALWKAAEFYIRDNQKTLEIGSEDYYNAVAEVYNRIILETQPNYTTMERPQMLRSDSDLTKTLAMFKTQLMQNYNIAYESIANLRAKERQLKAARDAARNNPADAERVKAAEQAVKEAKRSAANGISALLVSAAVSAGMRLLWNLFRGKMDKYKNDDGEVTALSFMKGFGGDFLSPLAGMVPFAGNLYDLVWSALTGETYYGIDVVSVKAISDFLDRAKEIPDNVEDTFKAIRGDKTAIDVVWSVDQLAVAASKLLGIPVENVQNLMKAVSLNVMKTTMPAEEADYWYRYYTSKTSASKRRSQDYADIYASAKAGNMDGYQEMRGKMEGWIWKENDSYQSGDISREEARERATETLNGAMQDRIQEEFLSGTMQEKEAKELLTEIAGFDKDDQRKLDETVLHWACERDTGIKYDDLKDTYLGGEISGKKAAEYIAKYGWNEADMEADEITEDAEATVRKWDYQEDSGNSKASASRADKYYEFAEPVGINISVFDEAYTFASNVEADKDKDGESISGSAKQKVVDYILGLGLSGEQERALWNAVKGNWSDKDTPWH